MKLKRGKRILGWGSTVTEHVIRHFHHRDLSSPSVELDIADNNSNTKQRWGVSYPNMSPLSVEKRLGLSKVQTMLAEVYSGDYRFQTRL